MNRHHPFSHRRVALGALASAASLLVACGGGGGSEEPSAFTVSGKVVDGPLQGATACYDLNDNRACDSGEPASAATGADGAYRIEGIDRDAIGKHRVVVNVPATAVDADTGTAVGRDFTLLAPATGAGGSQSVFVSPLTTLVQQQMDGAAQTRDEAVTFIQSQLALAVSPLADFTAAGGSDNAKAANASRVVLATAFAQFDALATAVGQTDLSGSVVTEDEVGAFVRSSLAASLPMIGAAAADATLQGKSGGELRDAVVALSAAVVAQAGLTVPEAVAAIGVAKLPAEPVSTATPEPGGSLAALRYTDAGNWYLRNFQSTAADNTPDANGLVRFYDTRMLTNATYAQGVSWVLLNDPTRAADRYWNGSTWRTCDLGWRSTSTVRDATGRANYNYCDGNEKGTTLRKAAVDISGQTLASVLTERIRTLPGGSSGVAFADWGPADLSLLGTATFPEGSRLFYQTGMALETAPAYDNREVSAVLVYSQAIADGGDGRNGAPAPACYEANPVPIAATTLEELVARNPGRPCIGGQVSNADGTSLSPNEGWWNSTASMGNVAGYFATAPAGTGSFYTDEARMRVTFTGSGNGTRYHACYTRRTNPSTRNCQLLGSGTYTIAALGDGRVMTFNNVPAAFGRITFERVFVERGGKVYFGYRNRVGIATPQVRLNMTAANAMLGQLGLPLLAPTGPN